MPIALPAELERSILLGMLQRFPPAAENESSTPATDPRRLAQASPGLGRATGAVARGRQQHLLRGFVQDARPKVIDGAA